MRHVFLVAVAVSALSGEITSEAQPVPTAEVQPVTFPRTERRVIRSTKVGETYVLQIYLPPDYEKADAGPFPVLYLLDGDRSFGMAVDVVGWLLWAEEIRPVVVCAIGYGDQGSRWWASRARDYTPCKDPSSRFGNWPQAGGADAFAAFLDHELFPLMASTYKVRREERALAGLSFGALFGAHALLTRPGMFQAYLLSGVPVLWGERYLFARLGEATRERRNLGARVYAALGEREPAAVAGPWKEFCRILEAAPPKGLEWKTEILPGESHISAWPVAFTRGLRVLFPPPPTVE
jgi:predicted alpha/beta superfamily hydrolase